MRLKLLVGGLGLVAAALAPSGFGSGGSSVALECPVGELETACGAASLVLSTACSDPAPSIGTVGFVTVDIEGGAPIQCPI